MTARSKRVVWTVPGAASDPAGIAAEQYGLPFFHGFSFIVFERGEGEE